MIGAVLGLLVVMWVWQSHIPWRDIGYVRPRSWILRGTIAFVLGVAFKLVMKAVVMPMLGADPINQHYHYLTGNLAALVPMIFIVVIGGGFGEETFYRGFLFERLSKIIGSGAIAKTLIILLTSTLFAVGHYYDQGLAGVEQAMITGLTFGTIFAVTGSLFPLIVAHAAFDLAALALIYWDLESAVAHLVFK